MQNLERNDTNELIYKTEKQTHRLREWVRGTDSQGVWDGHVHSAIFKMDNQQGPTGIAQGTLLNVMWQPGWEGSLGENGYMCMYGLVTLLFS